MAFSRDTIAAVKERADIVEIIGERVRLAPSGQDFVGLCPFHGEKTPSFRVSPSYRTYHCFGCGAGGSVIDFLMALENRSFPEAVTILAERYGVPMEDSRGGTEHRSRSLEALDCARDYFQELLLRRPEGEPARRYMLERGFEERDWEAFGLGFALDQWQGFTAHGLTQGFSEEDLKETGLVRAGNSGRLYDLLRNRVIFPISNERNRPIAFGGRVILPDENPKYINTPETRHYRKSRVLYGLAQGAESLRKGKQALLVEGYLDVMRLHQHGFAQAVATCGTALTEGHLQTLQRLADKAVLVFDGDAAGIKAALRCAPLFLNQGIEARVVMIPGGMDPDDFLVRQGRDAFAALLDEAESLLEFLVAQMLRRNGRTAQGREQTLEAVLPVLAQVRKPAARDMAVRFLADLIGVRTESVLDQLSRQGRRPAAADAPAAPMPTLSLKEDRHQRRVLRLLLEHPSLLQHARTLLPPREISDPDLRRLLERVLGFSDEEYAQLTPEQLMEWFPELAGTIRGLMLEATPHLASITDHRLQMENEIYCIKESLKDALFQQLKALEGQPEQERVLLEYTRARNELRRLKSPFRQSHPLRDEVRLRSSPRPPPDTPAENGN